MKGKATYELNKFMHDTKLRTSYPGKKLYASGLTCDRKAAINLRETTYHQDDGIMPFYTSQGYALEAVMQGKLRDSNVLQLSNLNVGFLDFAKNYDIEIGAEIDGVVTKYSAPILIEFKTCTYLPNTIEYRNVTQLAFYMSLFAMDSYIVYLSRTIRNKYGFQQKNFFFKYRENLDEIYQEVYKIFRADEYVKENKLPKAIKTKEHKNYCRTRCDWFSECHGRSDINNIVHNLEVDYKDNSAILRRAKERARHFLSVEEVYKRREALCLALKKP